MKNADVRVFLYDPGWISEVVVGIVSGLGVMVLAIYGLFVWPWSLDFLVLFVCLFLVGLAIAWWLIRYYGELTHEIEVTPLGLSKVKDDADLQFLYWIDVRRVQYRRLWSRLEVHGRSSRFIVGDRLENWKGLLEAIRQRSGREIETTWW